MTGRKGREGGGGINILFMIREESVARKKYTRNSRVRRCSGWMG
jgi:hypothetical protein